MREFITLIVIIVVLSKAAGWVADNMSFLGAALTGIVALVVTVFAIACMYKDEA